jgi:predicted regulator of Ras-like GTPase activity (Roadblock/LC7/MglB family)
MSKIKDVLRDLRESMTGIIGSFIMSDAGEVESEDVPELMADPIEKVSKTLHHVIRVIQATRDVEKLTVDSETVRIISLPADGRMLGVVTEKNINQPLFKLMSNMAVAKIKETPKQPTSKAPEFDVEEICEHYNQLFAAAAKRLANIIGPKSAYHFSEGAQKVRKSYPNLFNGIVFDSKGMPDMAMLREKSREISEKEELVLAFDEMLLSMLDTVKKIAGPKQEQKAMDEVQKIKYLIHHYPPGKV